MFATYENPSACPLPTVAAPGHSQTRAAARLHLLLQHLLLLTRLLLLLIWKSGCFHRIFFAPVPPSRALRRGCFCSAHHHSS